jgi:hypothetical protein
LSCAGSVAVPVNECDAVAVGSVRLDECDVVFVGIENVCESVSVAWTVSVSVPVSVPVLMEKVLVAVNPPDGSVADDVPDSVDDGRVAVLVPLGSVRVASFVALGSVNVDDDVGNVSVACAVLVPVPVVEGRVMVLEPVGRVVVASRLFVLVAATVFVVVSLDCASALTASKQRSEARIARLPVVMRTSAARARFERYHTVV